MKETNTNGADPIAKHIDKYEQEHSLINGFLTHQQKEDYPQIAQTIHKWNDKYTQQEIEQWLNDNSESLPYNL